MSAIDPHFTFAISARASGWGEAALRNNITRGHIAPPSPDRIQSGTWRRFNLLDIIVLAVTNRLARYGVDIRRAHILARETLQGPFTEIRKRGDDATGSDIAGA